MVKPFETRRSRRLLETPIFTMREDVAVHPTTGREAPYVVIEPPDWVNMIPVTEDGHLVMVRQWRHGTRRVELEFPAGMIDPGESPLEGAARELREETGYVASSWELIGAVSPNAAFQANTCHTALALGCRLEAEVDFDEGEELEVVLADVAQVRDWLRQGELRNGMTVVAVLWWLDHAGQVGW